MAVYALTDKCNLNCVFCSNEDFRVYYDPPDYHPHTLDEIKQYFREKVPEKDGNITLTGGEPTLRADLFRILDFISKEYKDSQITLLSNGRVFKYLDYCKKFSKYGKLEIEVALNSHREKIHDELTLTQGSYHQTYEGLKNLIDTGIKTNLRVIITEKNYRDLKEYSQFIKDEFRGINKVVFINPRIKGKLKENKGIIVKYSDFIPYLTEASELLMKDSIGLQFLHFPFCILPKNLWDHTLKNPYKKDMPQCIECSKKEDCPGVSESYIDFFGSTEFKKI